MASHDWLLACLYEHSPLFYSGQKQIMVIVQWEYFYH